MLPATTRPNVRKNTIHLFSDPRFETRLSVEDEILPVTNIHEVYAKRAVELWFSLPRTLKPQKHKEKHLIEKSQKELVAILKGNHPRVEKLSIEQIYTSMKNFNLAITDPNYRPASIEAKDKLRKNYNLLKFIYNPGKDKSMLVNFLNKPSTLETDTNPKLTNCLMAKFGKERWGGGKIDVPDGARVFFVRAAKLIVEHLTVNKHRFQFGMAKELSQPEQIAHCFIKAISQSSNWNNFEPHWICNKFSINKFDMWLKDQGYFKFN